MRKTHSDTKSKRDPPPTPSPRVQGLRTPGSRTDEITQREKPLAKKPDPSTPPEHRPTAEGAPFGEPAKVRAGREKPQSSSRSEMGRSRSVRTEPSPTGTSRLNGNAVGSRKGVEKSKRPKKRAGR